MQKLISAAVVFAVGCLEPSDTSKLGEHSSALAAPALQYYSSCTVNSPGCKGGPEYHYWSFDFGEPLTLPMCCQACASAVSDKCGTAGVETYGAWAWCTDYYTGEATFCKPWPPST